MENVDNPFTVLGVGFDASIEEVNAAWKAKVKKLHPDRYPEAPQEIVSRLNEEMSRINAAHKMLNDDIELMRRRFAPISTDTDQNDPSSRHRRPSDTRIPTNLCEVCGSMNTDTFKFSRQIGLVFVRRIGKFEARLCRECALAIGREYQSRTLSTGWWGVISFFTNVGYIFSNASELNRADRMMSPKSVSGYRSRPLDPGATVFTRPISWIGPAIIAILIALVIATGSSQTQGGSYDPDSGLNLDTPKRWAVGNCVVGLSSFTPVPCSEPHTGKIVSRVYSQLSCPSRTESFVSYNGSIFCIDEDA